MFSLSSLEVNQLIREPDPVTKAETVSRIATDFNQDLLSEREKEIVFEILRLLVRDTALIVRQTIAESLKNNPNVPHDILMTLVNDPSIDVAGPILRFSSALTESDLLSIIHRTTSVAKLLVISEREHLPNILATALIKRDIAQVSQAVVNNKTAVLTDENLEYLVNRYNDHPDFLSDLCKRDSLPLPLVETLFAIVGDDIAKNLASRYPIDPEIVQDAIKKGVKKVKPEKQYNDTESEKYRMIIQMGRTKINWPDMNNFITMLSKQNQLTPPLAIRAICSGNLMMFTCIVAKMADIPHEHARTIITGGNRSSIEALCRRASIATSLIQTLIEIILEANTISTDNISPTAIAAELNYRFKNRQDLPSIEQLLPLMVGE